MNEILNHLIILGIIAVALPLLYAGKAYLWNRKYIPHQLTKGKLKKPLGTILKEINNYTFKEDTGTLLKKGSPRVQKLATYKNLHILAIIAGPLLYVLTGNLAFLVTLPLSFIVGVSRALPVTNRRTQVLDRIFQIASSSIRFTAGPRAKNAVPPASWNHIQVEKWQGKETPMKMVITFPSGNGPELNAQKTFEKTFEANVTDENIWNFEWDLPHDRVTIEAAPHLPTKLLYPGSADVAWSVFPVGESSAGVASYDVATFPHALCAGPSGSGKSVLQRNIVFHTIQHNDRWRFLGVDLKRVELTPYNKYKKTVMGIATDVEKGLAVLKYAYNEMMDRYKEMEEIGVNNIMDMADPPHCILLMIDEATMFLGASGSKTEEGKAEDAMKAEASDLVGKILRLGRASGIHMLIAMQRPDATVLRGEFKANMDVRLAAGRMDSTPSSMVLDSGEAAVLPGIRGRGLIRVGGNLTVFQGYFAPQDWIDDFILKNPHVEPSTVAPGGHLHEKYEAMKRLGTQAAAGELEAVPAEAEPVEEPKGRKGKGLSFGKKKGRDEEVPVSAESAAPAPVEVPAEPAAPASVAPEFSGAPVDFEDEGSSLTESQQSLLESLNKREEREEGAVNELPDFFTGSARKEAPAKQVEPDLELDDEDFILDDFDDSGEEFPEPPADLFSAPAPEPAPVKQPKVKHEWVPASPFGGGPAVEEPALFGDDDEEEEMESEPAAPVSPVTPAPQPVRRPTMPQRPVLPEANAPEQAPASEPSPAPQRPQRPTLPTRPGTVSGNPFSPKRD